MTAILVEAQEGQRLIWRGSRRHKRDKGLSGEVAGGTRGTKAYLER